MLLDDTQIELTGRWAYHINPLIPNQFHSFHATNHTGDFASLNFTGTGIEVYGIVGPTNGNYSVRLDGTESTFSGLAATPQQGLLFSQQNLDGAKSHQIIITNQLEGHLLTVDLLNITQSSAASSSTSPSGISRGSIIAIALVAAFCVFILVGSLAYLILRRRRRAVAIERRRLAEESFRPRMRSLVLPSEQSAAAEDRYPWMRPISVANAPGVAAPEQENAPYDPYVQRRPIVGRPMKLAPPTGESDDEVVDIVPRTREELDALRPRPSNDLPPSSFGTPVSPSFARSRRDRQLDSGAVGSEPSVYDP